MKFEVIRDSCNLVLVFQPGKAFIYGVLSAIAPSFSAPPLDIPLPLNYYYN